MVTRVNLVQSGAPTAGFLAYIDTGTFNTQVGDLVLVFTRCGVVSTEKPLSAILADGGANTAMTEIDSSNVFDTVGRNAAGAYYKVITTARTGDSIRVNFTVSVANRVVDVIIYRPGSGGTLSFDVLGKSNLSAGYAPSAVTSAINTAGGGVLCTYVSGAYNNFSSTSVSAGYTKFGSDTVVTSLAEKFSATALSSETVTWTDGTSPYQYYIAYDVAIKDTSAATTNYEFQPFSRGIGRGIARGIA
jgi:hypothetical protein